MSKSTADLVRQRAARAWTEGTRLSARKIALYTLAGGLAYGVLRSALVGESLLRALGLGLGSAIGAVAGAFVVAPLVALLGWLTRGSFNMRPLFVACLAQTWLLLVVTNVFWPMSFQPLLGLPFSLLVALAMGVGTTVASFASLMTLVSHRYAYGMFRLALVLGIFSMFGAYNKYLAPGREAFMSAVFNESDAGLARAMDSRRYPSSVIETDFKAMARGFAEKR